ncbi:hypothetical protein H0H93_012309 [Arthromyces matolae]|nr:hypothetical protein H0H93_012309 [Arthromyces matolae]
MLWSTGYPVKALENMQTKFHGNLKTLSACLHCEADWGQVMTLSFPAIDRDECDKLGQCYADFATKASAKVKEELIKAGHGLIKFYSDVNLPQLVQIIMNDNSWGKKGLCWMDTIPEEADDILGRSSQL